MNRRRFLERSTVIAGAALAAPGILAAASQKEVSLAGIGVGGVGFGQLQECEEAGFRIVALCDVDDVYARKAFDRWPKARRYRDFRELLAKEREVEAVYIGTPDHTHAIIAQAALRAQKHLCCVKPLTRTLQECRTLRDLARESRVATQMTASPHTTDDACRTAELIEAGVLGAVREVHVWSNRPVWPQGMRRPAGEDPVPPTLDWDLWQGPAPLRPFKDRWPEKDIALAQIKDSPEWVAGNRGVYHPFNFRGWWDYGTGALGDMGCHHFNPVFRALKLAHPSSVQATATQVFEETAPLASIVTYDFEPRGSWPAVRMVWYDGGLQPPKPREMKDEKMPEEGTLYVSDEGRLFVSWEGLRLWPESKAGALGSVPKSLRRRGAIYQEWHEACRGGEPAGCEFEWASLLTENVLLGNLAIRTAQRLEYDPARVRITNHEAANRLVRPPARPGWEL